MNDTRSGILEEMYRISAQRAAHTVWILSDLQQKDADKMQSCLDTSMEDYTEHLGCPAEAIWYLGDAVEGSDRDHLFRMTDRQEKAFGDLGVPLYYAAGNHDFDYSQRYPEEGCEPFLDMVRSHPGWHTIATTEQYYFRADVGEYAVFFLSDHMAQDRSWCVTHGALRWGDRQKYPYTLADADALRDEIGTCGKKVITCSHYAFPGGNRQSALMGKLMPLPGNVCVHFYGHAHIGDIYWAGRDACRRICWVDYHDIPQINVSSFENVRGEMCRSVLLHIYGNGQMGIFWRTHDDHRFCEAYFPAEKHCPQRMEETTAYIERMRLEHPDWVIGNEGYRDTWE